MYETRLEDLEQRQQTERAFKENPLQAGVVLELSLPNNILASEPLLTFT